MSRHPSGCLIEIHGIYRSDRGQSCEEHDICGEVLHIDAVVRFRSSSIAFCSAKSTRAIAHVCSIPSTRNISSTTREVAAIAAYWITDGIDRCIVGFVDVNQFEHPIDLDGKIGQIAEFLGESDDDDDRARSQRLEGICMAAIITAD